MNQEYFEELIVFLEKLPAIDSPAGRKSIGYGVFENGYWWVKFKLNLSHPFAWRHVQELGHVLNLLSVEQPLPTIFKPVSPPPYMNGGEEFLSWVIESKEVGFTPTNCAKWLEGRLPSPVENLTLWAIED